MQQMLYTACADCKQPSSPNRKKLIRCTKCCHALTQQITTHRTASPQEHTLHTPAHLHVHALLSCRNCAAACCSHKLQQKNHVPPTCQRLATAGVPASRNSPKLTGSANKHARCAAGAASHPCTAPQRKPGISRTTRPMSCSPAEQIKTVCDTLVTMTCISSTHCRHRNNCSVPYTIHSSYFSLREQQGTAAHGRNTT
jgi:hypothetical protein